MAIGAVISHRNFTSFIASGKVHQPEQAILNQRAERVGYNGTQYNQKNMFTEKLSTLRGNYPFSRNLYCNSHRVTGATIRPRAALYYDGVQPYSVPQHCDGKNQIFTPRRPFKGKCECFLSLTPQGSNWTLPRKLNNLSTTSGHFQHCTEIRTRAGYRSEDNDMSGTDSDSFVSSEGGQGEAILAQEVQQIKPWWEIPKRWVIVLLCFTAFLLCNMDRSILNPMVAKPPEMGYISGGGYGNRWWGWRR